MAALVVDAAEPSPSFRERGAASVADADDRLLQLMREGWSLQDAGWPPAPRLSFSALLAFLVDERRAMAGLAAAAAVALVGALALSGALGVALVTIR